MQCVILHVYLHHDFQLRLMARMRICVVCIRTRERGSCQDSANAYANEYAYGSLHIYGPWTFERSANQEVNQTSKVTCIVTIWKLGRTV